MRTFALLSAGALLAVLAGPGGPRRAFAQAAADLSGLKAYPNPWRPGSGGSFDGPGILFNGLVDGAVIKIYTVAGDLVRRLDVSSADGGQKLWDGTNDGGDRAASGVYLYLATDPAGDSRRGRVAVIR